ncbi:MAG: PDZ domain-containing protein [Thermoguttaceae bacterium]|nr:PDZ domain-containing protein [Thermoguttaceae bacterium]
MFSTLTALILYTAPFADIQNGIAKAAPSIELPAAGSSFHHLDDLHSQQMKTQKEITAIIQNGKTLEKRGDLSGALKCYKDGYRKYPTSTAIQRNFSRMKVLCDIRKRYSSQMHLELILKMDAERFHLFVDDFLTTFGNFYHPLSPAEIFKRELLCINIALHSRDFCSRILPEYSEEEIQRFYQAASALGKSRTLQTHDELVSANLELGTLFEQHFRKKGCILVSEGLFSFIASLDTYSEVLLPVQHKEQIAEIQGELVGIGIEISVSGGKTYIQRLLPDSPAAQAGIRRGELITKIDGISTLSKSQVQVSEMLCGTEGTPVRLTLDDQNGRTYSVELFRRHVTYPSISCSRLIPDSTDTAKIGYVHLERFQDNTPDEVETFLRTFMPQGMDRMIIDLRGNPGGTVTSAVNTADLFLQDGVILKTQSRSHTQFQYHADARKYYTLPLAILIDEESASAAEIFAAALQDHQRGILIGKQSFGKWVIQSLLPIPNTPFHMKLTTSRFYSPLEHQYNHVGIEPDLVIHQTGKPIFNEEMDSQGNFSNAQSQMLRQIQDPVLLRAAELLSQTE